jgi:uncharacterized protein
MGYTVLFILLLPVLLLLYMWRTALLNHVLIQNLVVEKEHNTIRPFTVFFISDVHRRKINAKLIDFVRGKADIVIIGGDLREGGVSFNKSKQNIMKLKEIGPVYFVWGNNDYEGEDHRLQSLLLEEEVIILDNKAVSIKNKQGTCISLVGIEDISEKKARYDKALANKENADLTILISHNPLIQNQVKEEHQIDLVLSGHTHGGQIRIFGKGPYTLGGMKRKGNTFYLTSNGYGTSAIPLRLGAKPETHLLKIQSGSAAAFSTEKIEL